jgi:hypothetical protein
MPPMPGEGAGRTGVPIGGAIGRATGAAGAGFGATGLGAAGFGAVFFFAGLLAFLAVFRAGFRAAFLAVLRAAFFFAGLRAFLAVLRAGFRAVFFLAVFRADFRAVFFLAPVLRAEAFRALARLAVFLARAFFAVVLRLAVFLAPVLFFFLLVVRFFPLFFIAMAYAPILLQCRTRFRSTGHRPPRITPHLIQAYRPSKRVNHCFHYTMISKEVAIWDAQSATTNRVNRSSQDRKWRPEEPFRRPSLPVQNDALRSTSPAQGDDRPADICCKA